MSLKAASRGTFRRYLDALLMELKGLDWEEKNLRLDREQNVVDYLQESGPIKTFLQGLTPECAYVIKAILLLGQGETVFRGPEGEAYPFDQLRELLQQLLVVEENYDQLGGVIGYHTAVLRLLEERDQGSELALTAPSFQQPPLLSIQERGSEVDELIRIGIESMPQLAELYPIGGAGDRLNLSASDGTPLPCAKLPFLGRSLLEGMLRDLQAREALYERLTGEKVVVPVAMMTSYEKDNDRYMRELLEEMNYLGRSPEDFFLFPQPSVPVINEEGNWSLKAPLTLFTKPGGHGVIWSLAEKAGLFSWLKERGRSKLLLRQVNNPVAGSDYGLLAFVGAAIRDNKQFGFAACDRLVGSPEGMVVVEENETGHGIRTIEYTDFQKFGLEDSPREPGSSYSGFPSNTNILFADLAAVERLTHSSPIPGLLINMKSNTPFITADGAHREVKGGRLESMMQALADYMIVPKSEPFPTVATYNLRSKTISVAKQAFIEGASVEGTPEGAFREMMSNHHLLLSQECGVELPPLAFEKGPSMLLLFHPALGPNYSLIAQKIRGGSWSENSECQLEVTDASIENLELSGSLLVEASEPLNGYVELSGCEVNNQGIDRDASSTYWSNQIVRKEALTIRIERNAAFVAEDVSFEGDHTFEVKEGTLLRVSQQLDGSLKSEVEPLANFPRRSYRFGKDNQIELIS